MDLHDDARNGRVHRHLVQGDHQQPRSRAAGDFSTKLVEDVLDDRRPSRTLTGLLRGPTAQLTDDDLREIIKHQKEDENIEGLMEFVDVSRTKNENAIIRLRADEQAMQRLVEIGLELHIAMAGRVLFDAGRAPPLAMTTDADDEGAVEEEVVETDYPKRIAAIEASLKAERAKMAEAIAKRTAGRQDDGSVDGRMNRLQVGEENSDEEDLEVMLRMPVQVRTPGPANVAAAAAAACCSRRRRRSGRRRRSTRCCRCRRGRRTTRQRAGEAGDAAGGRPGNGRRGNGREHAGSTAVVE